MPSRFTPPTPRSRRLGRELRTLRERSRLTLEYVGVELRFSASRLSRIESGEIRARPGDVMELLTVYDADPEHGQYLIELARDTGTPGWWARLDALSQRYLTYIGFEAEAATLRNFEPLVVPGLLQTEAYATAVIALDREAKPEAIAERVRVRLRRQELLRAERPLRLHAVLSEAVPLCEVGGVDVMREQCKHLAEVSRLPNVTIQVMPFAAGARLAIGGGFAVLGFKQGDPDLGYLETPAGELFLESPHEIERFTTTFDSLLPLSLSPAESARHIRKRGSA